MSATSATSASAVRQLLGIEVPIIQAPMAGAQGSAMTIAVSNAGALGSLGCALLSPKGIRRELETIRAQTDKPFSANFFCHRPPEVDPAREARWRRALSPFYRELGLDESQAPTMPVRTPFGDEAADVLEEFAPPVLSFHYGLPSPSLVARVKGWGAKIISSATTVDEARWLEDHGADAIIAQGLEAGGHRGMFLSEDLGTQIGTLALVPQVARAVRVPVIAAGGIADADGIAAVLALGASAVQLGTTFLLCPEATISPPYRAALKSEAARNTVLTNVFTGRPARCIVNRVVRECGPISDAAPAFPLAAAAIAPLREAAERQGLTDFLPMWSGQNATGCREVPAAQLVRELAAQLAARQGTRASAGARL